MEVLRTLKERCDPRLAALVVVDVQNDFVSPQGSAAKRDEDVSSAMAMVPTLTHLIDEGRRVGLTIVYIRTTHSEWTDTPSWIYRKSQQSALTTCREGTWGAELYEGISPLPSERVVIKHRYSAFINTDLNTVLKAKRNPKRSGLRSRDQRMRGNHGSRCLHVRLLCDDDRGLFRGVRAEAPFVNARKHAPPFRSGRLGKRNHRHLDRPAAENSQRALTGSKVWEEDSKPRSARRTRRFGRSQQNPS